MQKDHSDEAPYRALLRLGEMVETVVKRELDEHVEREHHNGHTGEYQTVPTAIPFAGSRIEDAECARMIELLETTDLGLNEVANYLGYPPSLARRCLAQYAARYEFWCDRIPYVLRQRAHP